jgi:hypothetical protein
MHGDAEHMPLAAVREGAEVLFDALTGCAEASITANCFPP